jgi:ribosomal subunit interface protein
MQIPLQISIRGMPHSAALDAEIRERAARLDHFDTRITSCRVVVEELARHHRQGREFAVRVEIRAPGREEIVASRNHDEDVYIALRDAFDAAVRQLEDEVRKRRGDVKAHEPVQHGVISRIASEGDFGFIKTSDGRELYFSRENVTDPEFEHLHPGDNVQFLESAGAEGLQAKRVTARRHGAGTT